MSSLGRLEAHDGRAAVHTVEGVSSSVWQYLPYISPYTGERFGIAQSHLGVYAVRRGKAQPLEAFSRERLGSKKGKRLGGTPCSCRRGIPPWCIWGLTMG